MIDHPYNQVAQMEGCIMANFPTMYSGTVKNVDITDRFVFNGDGSIVNPAPSTPTAFTEIVRFKTGSDITTLQGVSGCTNASSLYARYGWYIKNGRLWCIAQKDNSSSVVLYYTLQQNIIYTTAMTVTSTEFNFYLDSQLVDSTTIDDETMNWSNYHRIGAYGSSSNDDSYFFTGEVFTQFVFNRALSAEEIAKVTEMINLD